MVYQAVKPSSDIVVESLVNAPLAVSVTANGHRDTSPRLVGTVSSGPRQKADFRCDGPAMRRQLTSTSGKTRSRPSAGARERPVWSRSDSELDVSAEPRVMLAEHNLMAIAREANIVAH
jgi:hypothetical protein